MASSGTSSAAGIRYHRDRYISPLSWIVSGTSTPIPYSHSGIGLRRPLASTTTSAVSHVPSSRRTPPTDGMPAVAQPRSATGPGSRPLTPVPVRTLDVRLGQDGLAQQPLQRGAADDEDGEVLVAGLRIAEVVLRRHGDAPDVAQRLEDVGEVLAQLDDEAGEEAVGLVDLRGAAAVGVEGLLDVAGRGQGIAFEQDHGVSGPTQRQRRAEPGDAGADHDDAVTGPHGTAPRSACSDQRSVRPP